MKRGKMLGGKPPRRGGRLVGAARDRQTISQTPVQIVVVLVIAVLVLLVAGAYLWSIDRQLRRGLVAQREEARQRADWVALGQVAAPVRAAFLLTVDPAYPENAAGVRTATVTLPRDLVRQVHQLEDGLGDRATERVMASLLELHLTSTEIFELYLNRVGLGSTDEASVHGLYHASREYLGKDPRDLTVSEAATLAGLLLEPRIQLPVDAAGAVGARRNEVLAALRQGGIISADEYALARRERLGFRPGLQELPVSRRIPSPADTMAIRFTAPLRQPDRPQ